MIVVILTSPVCQRAGAQEVSPREIELVAAEFAHQEPEVRREAAQFATQHPDVRLLNVLVRGLSDSDPMVRQRSVVAIRSIPEERADQAVLAAMKHADHAVRQYAVDHFNNPAHQERTPGAVDALAAALTDMDNSVRQRAATALRVSKDERATAILLSALKHADPDVRRQAVQRLHDLPNPQSIDPLVAALDDLDRQVRSVAARALNRIDDPRAKAAAGAAMQLETNVDRNKLLAAAKSPAQLRVLFVHRDNDVRRMAAEALRRLDSDEATRTALAALDNPDPQVRRQLVERFREKPDAAAEPQLRKMLDDPDPPTRHYAINALRATPGEPALQARLAAFHHHDALVRQRVVDSFRDQPDARAVPLLVEALHDLDPQVRREAAHALRRTDGDEAKTAALAALAALDHPDVDVRNHVIQRFAEKPDAGALAALVKVLDKGDSRNLRSAVRAIGASASADAPEPLAELLYRDDAELRGLIAAKLKPIIDDANRFVESPLAAEHTIARMQSLPPIAMETPSCFVEMVGGDRIVGEVVGCAARGAAFEGGGEHLLVKPLRLTVQPPLPSPPEGTEHARVRTRWIRRIVCQSQGLRRYSPGVLFLRHGGRMDVRSLRWEPDGVAVLNQAGVQRVPFGDIAELHLPRRDPWRAYCEQLAVLGCQPTDKLLRLEFTDGSQVTASAARFTPFSNVQSAEPDEWTHTVHPAWCLDGLAAQHRRIGLRSWLPASEAPLFLPLGNPSTVTEIWPWQPDRNVQGGRLKSGGRQYGWGFGVHADNMLRFPLPPFATGFRTELGLDRIVGPRGCARGVVRLRTGDHVREIYRGPLLIGSQSVQDTGNLSLSPLDGPADLELVSDAAAGERPAGAEPLNICDMLDWLEPRLRLDRGRLFAAVAEAASQLDPALLERQRVFDWRTHAAGLVQRASPAIVSYTVEDRRGEGVLLGNGGHVLTAGHVLAHSGLDARVQLQDGRTFEGKTLGIYRDADLGLIGIGPQPNLPSLELSTDGELARPGTYVGLSRIENEPPPQALRSFTTGIIDGGAGIRTIRTRYFAAVKGSPLLNEHGQVVGIHTGSAPGSFVQFCRVYRVPEVWDRLTAGEVWGVWLLWSAPRVGIVSTGTEQGARIDRVDPGSSAAEAGLQVGDLIYQMDGQPVINYFDMEPIKGRKDAGDTVTFGVRRGEQTLEFGVRLMPR